MVELLQGHNVGLQSNYLRLRQDEMYAEFLKAEGELTISEESTLRQELEKTKIEQEAFKELKQRIKKLEEYRTFAKTVFQRMLDKDRLMDDEYAKMYEDWERN